MKYVLSVTMTAGFLCIAMAAIAQSTASQATPSVASYAGNVASDAARSE